MRMELRLTRVTRSTGRELGEAQRELTQDSTVVIARAHSRTDYLRGSKVGQPAFTAEARRTLRKRE